MVSGNESHQNQRRYKSLQQNFSYAQVLENFLIEAKAKSSKGTSKMKKSPDKGNKKSDLKIKSQTRKHMKIKEKKSFMKKSKLSENNMKYMKSYLKLSPDNEKDKKKDKTRQTKRKKKVLCSRKKIQNFPSREENISDLQENPEGKDSSGRQTPHYVQEISDLRRVIAKVKNKIRRQKQSILKSLSMEDSLDQIAFDLSDYLIKKQSKEMKKSRKSPMIKSQTHTRMSSKQALTKSKTLALLSCK